MRTVSRLIALMLVLTVALVGTANACGGDDVTGGLAGERADLTAALGAPSNVDVRLAVYTDPAIEDLDAFLDRILETSGWPEEKTLLLMIFPQHNYDIRFAMGASFRKRNFTVKEMVQLVHTVYFPEVRKGNPAGGAAALVRAVKERSR